MSLILGPGKADMIHAQGPRRVFTLLAEEWRRSDSYGLVRLLRLFLLVTILLFPQVYLDWILSRGRTEVDARILAVWRDASYIPRLAAWPIILAAGWWQHTLVIVLVVYAMIDMIRGPLGGVLAWGRHSISPVRSLIWTLINYAELVLAFAVLYLHYPRFYPPISTATHAVYFSAVTAATVGFGDTKPATPEAQRLVTAQIAVAGLFALLIVASLLSRVDRERRNP